MDNNRPPLANQLFANRPGFAEDLDMFPQCKPIVPHLRTGREFEKTLQDFKTQSESAPQLSPQLAAIRFYLRQMLWRCEDRWRGQHRGVTNYQTLLHWVNIWRYSEEPILLVTFNYDRMLESALGQFGQTFTNIADYLVSKRFPVFKLHGSVNWGHLVRTQIVTEEKHPGQIARELIGRTATLQFTGDYAVLDDFRTVNDRARVYFPAIALPVEQKVSFECPDDHMAALQEKLPHVTRILTIGWRGSEMTFLDLLRKHLSHPVPIQVIAKDGREATDIGHHLNGNRIAQTIDAYPGGFTSYVVSRDGERFLRN